METMLSSTERTNFRPDHTTEQKRDFLVSLYRMAWSRTSSAVSLGEIATATKLPLQDVIDTANILVDEQLAFCIGESLTDAQTRLILTRSGISAAEMLD